MPISLTGLDEEALTDLEIEARVRQVEGALRGLSDGSSLFQYTRVMSGFDLPRQKEYGNEVTGTFASDRLAHLDKTASFRRIDLHWCLTLEPSQAKAFQRKPDENVADTSRMLSDLEKTATLLEGHLGSSFGLSCWVRPKRSSSSATYPIWRDGQAAISFAQIRVLTARSSKARLPGIAIMCRSASGTSRCSR